MLVHRLFGMAPLIGITDKSHMVISVGAEKALNKVLTSFLNKNLQ
jgi:hypothetical protein